MSHFFPKSKPCEPYATKADFKHATGTDTSKLSVKSDFAEIDQLDIDKIVPFPVDMSKLSDVVKKSLHHLLFTLSVEIPNTLAVFTTNQ